MSIDTTVDPLFYKSTNLSSIEEIDELALSSKSNSHSSSNSELHRDLESVHSVKVFLNEPLVRIDESRPDDIPIIDRAHHREKPKKQLKSVKGRSKTPPLLSNPRPFFPAKESQTRFSQKQQSNALASLSNTDLSSSASSSRFLKTSSSSFEMIKKTAVSKWSFFSKFFKRNSNKQHEKIESFHEEKEQQQQQQPQQILEKFDTDLVVRYEPLKSIQEEEDSTSEVENDLDKDQETIELARLKRRSDFIAYVQGTKRLNKDFVKKYQIMELLGDGAFGFVIVAKNQALDIDVAVKFIMKEQIGTSWWIADNTYGTVPVEVHILSHLNHPNIIKFLDYFEDDDYCYLVTELHGTEWDLSNPKLNRNDHPGLRKNASIKCAGNNLLTFVPHESVLQKSAYKTKPEQIPDSLMKRKRTSCDLFECIDAHQCFNELTARHIFKQIVSAINYLHQNGVVHRDLKEENMVVDENYELKLIDFGAAMFIPESEQNYFKHMNGTPDYSAPEVILGKPYRGPEAEIWSLGILLFVLVFRQTPFQNADNIVQCDIQYPFKVHSRPKDALDLINCLLRYDPMERLTIDEIYEHPWMKEGPDSAFAMCEYRPVRSNKIH